MMDLANAIRFDSDVAQQAAPWIVLVADDEPEVHQVTHLVLDDFQFDGRGVRILDATSSDQAYELLKAHPDTAVLLLDVVMESEQAGLHLVERIRKQLGNRFVRIVLRTGQPGQAPERDVVAAYDINDYKEKTELTADKLVTTLIAALRAYRDMRTIEAQRLGMQNVIDASRALFAQRSSREFNATLLTQFRHLLGPATSALCCAIEPADEHGEARMAIHRGIGEFKDLPTSDPAKALAPEVLAAMHEVRRDQTHMYTHDFCIFHFAAPEAGKRMVFLVIKKDMQQLDHQLLWLFGTNAAIAYDNLHLHNELVNSQLDMLNVLASTAESRSGETAHHVHRVGLLAELLAIGMGQDISFCEHLRHAAPLHDIGKIGIPDSILNKPGVYTDDEHRIMRAHAQLGEQLLADSTRPILRLAAEVARTHHENWDGSGYPDGLKGTNSPIGGRITLVADVFDALGSNRCYRQAWDDADIRAYMREQSGHKFDPAIIECLFAHWHEATRLRHLYPDPETA